MSSKKELIYEYLEKQQEEDADFKGLSTRQIAEHFGMQRTNASSLLSVLVKEKRVKKIDSWPVLYQVYGSSDLKADEDSCFCRMIGFDRSLKNAIQLAKAAILYPQHSLPILLKGENGSGKSLFAAMIHQFAREKSLLDEKAPFLTFDCRSYGDDSEEMYKAMFGRSGREESIFWQAQSGILFIEHAEFLKGKAKAEFLLFLAELQEEQTGIIVCSICNEADKLMLEALFSYFPVRIEIPSLQNRSLEERWELIQLFFTEESANMKQEIKINGELLRCLLLYRCDQNIRQLKGDIRLGCANAYAREMEMEDSRIHTHLQDFPVCVRKGLLYYQSARDAVEALIGGDYSYIVSAKNVSFQKEQAGKKPTVYEFIRNKAEQLRKQGIEEGTISGILEDDIKDQIQTFTKRFNRQEVNMDTMGVVVNKEIMDIVSETLKKASLRLKRIYSAGIYHALCLHLSITMEMAQGSNTLNDKLNLDVIEKYKEEYVLAAGLAAQIEERCHVKLPIDEVVFITMFLSQNGEASLEEKHPAILVAMHGDGIAEAVVRTVKQLIHVENIFFYDLVLTQDMQSSYENFKQAVLECDNGTGVLIIYDMGSIRVMAETVSQETHIPIRMLEVPATLIVIDSAIKAEYYSHVDDLYTDVHKTVTTQYTQIYKGYNRKTGHPVIITLCSSGKGGAKTVKNYLEANLGDFDINIMNLAINDRAFLMGEIERIQTDSDIVCVIGAYDPMLHGIPFVPLSQIFEVNADKLPMLLTLDQFGLQTSVNYDAICNYLNEEMPELDVYSLRKLLPRAINKINRQTAGLSQGQELGLFMHIACSVYRLQMGEKTPVYPNKAAVFKGNKKLLHRLKEILRPLEEFFLVQFPDDEYANIICIIKQL